MAKKRRTAAAKKARGGVSKQHARAGRLGGLAPHVCRGGECVKLRKAGKAKKAGAKKRTTTAKAKVTKAKRTKAKKSTARKPKRTTARGGRNLFEGLFAEMAKAPRRAKSSRRKATTRKKTTARRGVAKKAHSRRRRRLHA